jgi:hypothetical protein
MIRRSLLITTLVISLPLALLNAQPNKEPKILGTEKVSGQGLWIHDKVTHRIERGPVQVKIWFDKQLLGTGQSYLQRAKTLKGWKRSELRKAAVKSLKTLSEKTWKDVAGKIKELMDQGSLRNLERHWIINGLTATIDKKGLEGLKKIKAVKKIFFSGRPRKNRASSNKAQFIKPVKRQAFDPDRYKHPWYISYLLARKTWKTFKVTGKGTLNIVHDGHFIFTDNLSPNLYRNAKEIPGNNKDDDGNGLIDDYHGWNFSRNSPDLSPRKAGSGRPASLHHGYLCATIISGVGVKDKSYEFAIAPESRWAGVIAGGKIEAAVEWAVEQKADTYSMSFSMPNLGEYRSHWRKVLEHGSFCGIYFVSGAGNFAKTARVPVQMRTPEDIPNAVFAAAGIRKDFGKTPFSSQGPVNWNTEHYKDGTVQKPAVCAFNFKLPKLNPDGTVRKNAINGNSFAGPMYCGAIALLLSADPELLPWELRDIITSTATDVGPKGLDTQTGHGLINCYRAVKETLRRKALRQGKDPSPYEGREKNDVFRKF